MTGENWAVLFGGAGRESVIRKLLDDRIPLSSVIVPRRRSEKLSTAVDSVARMGVPVVEVARSEVSQVLRRLSATALLSIGFPYLLSPDDVSRFKWAINIHPTLLPKYRGPTTAAHVILNDDRVAGSTVHVIAPEMDRGGIILQSWVNVSLFDTIRSMQRKVYASEPQLVAAAIAALSLGAVPVPQDESLASEYPEKRRPEDSQLDAGRPLKDLFNEIRACDPNDFPAYFFIHGEKVYVRLWRSSDRQAGDDEL